MFKGTLIFIFFNSIFFSTSMFLSAMNTNVSTEMVEIIKENGEKALLPLSELVKKITPITPQQTIQTSAGLLSSTYKLISAYPKEFLAIIGYASLIGSAVYFANSKHCFISPKAYAQLREEKKAALDSIAQEETEVATDIYAATEEFILKQNRKRLKEARTNYFQTHTLEEILKNGLEIVVQEESDNHALLIATQKKVLESILQDHKEAQGRQREYFKQRKQVTQQVLNTAFSDFNKFSNNTREDALRGIESIFDTIKQNKVVNVELNRATKSHFDVLSFDVTTIEDSSHILEEITSQLDRSQDLSLEDIASLSQSLEEQKRILSNIEANISQNNQSNTLQIVFTPTYEN